MTREELARVKALENSIFYAKEDLYSIEDVINSEGRLFIQSYKACSAPIPENLRDSICEQIKAEYVKRLEELQKEFSELVSD